MNKKFAALVGLAFLAGAGVTAQQPAGKPAAAKQPAKHVMISVEDTKWGPGPPGLPPGAQAAVLSGDPGKPGLFILRAKLPDGYAVPPHSHPTDEHVMIVSGTLMMGMGAKAEESSMHAMNAGGYAKMPARAHHYVRAKGETVIQVTATGPFAITYVNPDDDPRKKAPSK